MVQIVLRLTLHATKKMIRSLYAALLLLVVAGAAPAAAQAYNYPALQTPRIVDREFNFEVASASASGTALLFQWREGLAADWQFGFDGGLATPQNQDTRLLLGGSIAYQVMRMTADFPFDIAITGGLGFSGGDAYTVVRIPIGASVGHTFDLDNGMSLTPFAHPRLSVDDCTGCRIDALGRRFADSRVNVDVDLGVDFRMTPQVALRLAVLLGASDYTNGGNSAVGISVAWTPKGLKK